jgi:hypothetical protein
VPAYLFDLQDVARHNLWCLDLLQLAITENSGLEREGLLQLLDNGAGLIFLNETNAGIEQEQCADDAEVDPILQTSSKDGGSLAASLA